MLISIAVIIQLGVGHGIFERRPPNGKLSLLLLKQVFRLVVTGKHQSTESDLISVVFIPHLSFA